MSQMNKYLLALPFALSVAALASQASAQETRDAAITRCIKQAQQQFPNQTETDARSEAYKACMVAAGFQP
jgi:hypothetical protein